MSELKEVSGFCLQDVDRNFVVSFMLLLLTEGLQQPSLLCSPKNINILFFPLC